MSAPTFGQVLRGYRTGFGYLVALDTWVRVSDNGDGNYLIEVEDAQPGRGRTEYFYAWWDDADMRRMLTNIIDGDEGHANCLVVNDYGEVVWAGACYER